MNSNDQVRPIPGYPGYSVSRDGRVKGKQGRWLNPAMNKDKHRQINIYRNGRRCTLSVHRAVLLAWVGPCPVGMESYHKDGDALNNHADNLKWVPHSDNMRGTSRNRGEKNASAKLTIADVRAIRELLRLGHSHSSIAERYNVRGQTIGAIKAGRSWGWLT